MNLAFSFSSSLAQTAVLPVSLPPSVPQECSQTPDVPPSQDAPGRSSRCGSELSPGSCGSALFGAFHRPQPGLCRAVWGQQHFPGGSLRPGDSDWLKPADKFKFVERL